MIGLYYNKKTGRQVRVQRRRDGSLFVKLNGKVKNISEKDLKDSRKSHRKSGRKSHHVSRRKSGRKSTRKSRKSRKSGRKSRHVSRRKSGRKSRKSRHVSRRKSGRKSRKSGRKSRRVSHKFISDFDSINERSSGDYGGSSESSMLSSL